MKTGNQKDLREHLLVEHGIKCSAAAISKRVKAKDYRIQFTPGGKIKLEETAKALADTGFPASNFKGKSHYLEPAEESKSDFPEFPIGWIGGSWKGETTGFEALQNELANMTGEFELGRMSDLDSLQVLIEVVTEYFQAFKDHKEGRKYKLDEVINDDDAISIQNKEMALEYCKRLIEQFESDIQQLRDGTYYPEN